MHSSFGVNYSFAINFTELTRKSVTIKEMWGKTDSIEWFFSEQAKLPISTVVFIAPSAGIAKSMHLATSFLKQIILKFWMHQ